jgi:hypothetical protein
MALSSDWREFLELLNARGVDYVVVGAHCLAFYGRPRYTGDLDLLVRPSKSNAVTLVALLREFGFGESKFTPVDFAEADQVIQLGRPPNRVYANEALARLEPRFGYGGSSAPSLDER